MGTQGQAGELPPDSRVCRQCRRCVQGAVHRTCQKACRACPYNVVTGADKGLSLVLRTKGPGSSKAVVSGGAFKVAVKVRNLGGTDLQHIGLRVTVPFEVEYKRVDSAAILASPNVYWLDFSLPAGKTRRFRLWATVSPCQAPGAFVVDAAVSLAGSNTSSAAAMAPTQVSKERERGLLLPSTHSPTFLPSCLLSFLHHRPQVMAGKTLPKHTEPCNRTFAPTPTGPAPFALYAEDQRCLESRPWYTFGDGVNDRRMQSTGPEGLPHAGHRVLAPADSLDDCDQACYSVGLRPRYYFAVSRNECYCCPTW